MGQKVNPLAFRLPLTGQWRSRWFATKNYRQNLVQDARIRSLVTKKLGPQGGIDRIVIERKRETITITLYTGRPGVIIGRAGTGIANLRQFLQQKVLKLSPSAKDFKLLINEVRIPELSAAFVAQNIGVQISRRINFRRAVKQAIEKTMARGAKGIKVTVAGRLHGAEIARTEKFIEGRLPLSRLGANIDFFVYHAPTNYGIIGVKVWIYKGELEEPEEGED